MIKKLLILLLLCSTVQAWQQNPTLGQQLNRGHKLGKPIACWLFNEGSGGKVFDLSGNQNIGTLQGDPIWVPGLHGSCLDFDGNGDYVDVAHSSSINFDGYTDSYTVLLWVKALNPDTYRIIEKSGGDQYPISIQGVAETCNFYIYDENNIPGVALGDIWNGEWHQIVFVVNNATDYLYGYLDGLLKDSTANSVTGTTANNNILRIAHSPHTPTREFNGQIDHAIIWNRALMAGEIALLYREPFCMFEPPLDLSLYAVIPPTVGGQVIIITSALMILIPIALVRKYRNA